jgi:uncharacterized protein involved in propanediol utilization
MHGAATKKYTWTNPFYKYRNGGSFSAHYPEIHIVVFGDATEYKKVGYRLMQRGQRENAEGIFLK